MLELQVKFTGIVTVFQCLFALLGINLAVLKVVMKDIGGVYKLESYESFAMKCRRLIYGQSFSGPPLDSWQQ